MIEVAKAALDPNNVVPLSATPLRVVPTTVWDNAVPVNGIFTTPEFCPPVADIDWSNQFLLYYQNLK